MDINYIIEFILTAGLGVISFFLKRTIDELDSCKHDIAKIKAHRLSGRFPEAEYDLYH